MAEVPPDLDERLRRLAEVGARCGVDALIIREPANLSWLTGARWHVPQTLDATCFDLLVDLSTTPPALTAVTNSIEMPRLRDTELAGWPVEWVTVPWWQTRDAALPPQAGSDRARAGDRDLSAALAALRRSLTTVQRRHLAQACIDAAAATETALRLTTTTTEYAAAGALADELLRRELDPVCLFVAGGERGVAHRHPLPTAARLGPRAMLVCCARRHGLIASVTRCVSFQPLPAIAAARYAALLEVERAFLDATVVGARLGDVFAAGVAAYREHGFAPDEWQRHHQGGLIGWAPREALAHHANDYRLVEHEAVAWNPSGDGWKVEDTCLITDQGVRPLVHDPAWPTLPVGFRHRPDVLVRD